MTTPWQEIVREKRARREQLIPKAWLITPPPADVLDVTSIPVESGLLTSRELDITNTTDVDTLLAKLASSEWTSVEVTTAFYKRAIIAHQLVSPKL